MSDQSAHASGRASGEPSTDPVTILFDVNETLSDLGSVADAFESVGAAPTLSATWFGTVLRDGFALTSAGADASFPEIAKNNAYVVLRDVRLDREIDDAVDAVMEAFSSVQLHPDVVEGIEALHDAGHRLFTLSNGPTSSAERLLGDAGILTSFDDLLSVEGHSPWKPARASYLDALARTGTDGTSYLVAVHPWDIHGAAAAGLSTAWVNRSGGGYPSHFLEPTVTVATIGELAEQLDRSAEA